MHTKSFASFLSPLVLVAVTAAAPAQAGDPAAAQALFNEGKQLMTAGRFAEACPKLEESQRLDPGIGTLFHFADCEEHLGKTATAWASFLEVASTAKASGQPAREKVARDRAAALEPVLARFSIVIGAAASIPGLEVRRDGALVGKGQWGASLPIDPGDHEVRASAPGKRPFVKTVHVDPKSRQSVDVPMLSDAPVAVAPVAAVPPVGAVAPTPVIAQPAQTSSQSAALESSTSEHGGLGAQRAFAIGLGVAGLAGVGIGTYFGLTSKSNHDDAASHCNGNACDAAGVSLRDDAMRNGTISTVAFAAGGAAILGSIVLLATAKDAKERASTTGHARPSPQVGTSLGISPGGMTFQGAF